MSRNGTLEILDCTIRDGGYVNGWRFDDLVVRESYRALSKSGVDYIELGFRTGQPHHGTDGRGPWRFGSETDLRRAVGGLDGPTVALMVNYGEFAAADLCHADDSLASMIRIAAHKTHIRDALELAEGIKAKGYITSLQAMAFASYTTQEMHNLLRHLKDSTLDYFYIADTYGALVPNDIQALFAPCLELDNVKIGFHPHNNLQMAFANTLEAIRLGVDIVDSSIYGMGRGAGNLPTEVLIAYLSTQGAAKYNVVPILNCIDRYYVDIMRQHPWGYKLPYMISGMFNCHPYYAAEFVNRKEYTIEDVWRALEVIAELKPVGFDASLVDELIRKGVVGGQSGQADHRDAASSVTQTPNRRPAVPYLDRHAKRDFLILANGPNLKRYRGFIHEFIKTYNPVCLGANNLSGMFEPDYHAFTNKHRFVAYAHTVSPRSRLLVGENIPDDMIREYTTRDYESLAFIDVLDAEFGIDDGVVLANCRTVSVLLLGVAMVMGAARVFAAGMDGYLDTNAVTKALFYDEAAEPDDYKVLVDRHRWNEHFLIQIDQYLRDRHREGIRILTPTSHQRFYKSIENYLPLCAV